MTDWLARHAWEVGVFSVGMLLAGLIAVPIVVRRLPTDHFVTERTQRLTSPVLWLLRQILGWLLIVAGIAMLVLPGQGILTMLLGLSLVDFPMREAAERMVLRSRKVQATMQWMRLRGNKPPLVFPD